MAPDDPVFPTEVLQAIIGGASALDLPRLHLDDRADAARFLEGYGFDWERGEHRAELEAIRRGAIALIEDELLGPGERVPATTREECDVRTLLVRASAGAREPGQRWACAVLRVMHVMAHAQSPFEERYGDAIREQIVGRFVPHVHRDGGHIYLGAGERVPLEAFEVRPAKSPRSAVMKLLHKPENVAAELFDRIGVRFVTPTRFDALLVVRYLRRHHVITFPNIKPSRSQNTLVDLAHLAAEQEALAGARSAGHLDPEGGLERLRAAVLAYPPPAESHAHNPHRAPAYRSIQLTTRQIIRVIEPGGRALRFFFPFEVQILDAEGHATTGDDGPAAHAEYKRRQRESVRQRVLGDLEGDVPGERGVSRTEPSASVALTPIARMNGDARS